MTDMTDPHYLKFRRKMYDQLLAWKRRYDGSTAAMIEGARRVGKSTIAEEFGRNEYRSYVLIDFSEAGKGLLEMFDNFGERPDDLFMYISAQYSVKLYRRESLIIFDEVQKFPRARELIKSLVKDGRYDYIETGSLISIRENVKDIVIPSEEKKMRMYPMDFEEFCWAFGEDDLVDLIRTSFSELRPLPKSLHLRAMLLFKQYMMIGGMPQSVHAYLRNDRDFDAADDVKGDILELYRDDIMKIPASYASKVQSIFDQIPSFLSKHDKQVVLSDVAKGSTIDRYADTFFWLGNSMICNECSSVSDPDIGFSGTEGRRRVKCYMGDTGLLVTHTYRENGSVDPEVYRRIIDGEFNVNKGMLYENAISQMLVASGHRLFFYVLYDREAHRNEMEIDFLLSVGNAVDGRIIPVEVKSGPRYSTVSMDRFRKKFGDRIERCYVVHPAQLKVVDGVIRIPPYMAMCIRGPRDRLNIPDIPSAWYRRLRLLPDTSLTTPTDANLSMIPLAVGRDVPIDSTRPLDDVYGFLNRKSIVRDSLTLCLWR